MLRIYSTITQQFTSHASLDGLTLTPDMVWLDMASPTQAFEQALEQLLSILLPTREEMQDIEPSSRLYTENGATYMTATLLLNADSDQPETTNIAFILYQGRLITIRYAEPRPFRMFQSYAEKHGQICTSGPATLLSLLDAVIDRTAEVLEQTGVKVDAVSKRIFKRRNVTNVDTRKANAVSVSLENALGDIAFYQNITSLARDSLISLSRMVSFMMLDETLTSTRENREHLKSISRDLSALSDQTNFLSNTIIFLLDASLGLISIQQNTIIKIFSVVAVIFLPPTLIASIYGMNFHFMPELGWHLGYPMALALMALAAVLPYWWFKRKGWL